MSIDISVVIATYNQRARLRLVLCGLAGQHFPKERFEIIIVDNDCTDGTDAMLAAEYPDVHVVPIKPNVGRCRSRNAGVEQAQGALVAFLDGDALPHPAWLEHLWTEWECGGYQRYLCGFMYSLPLIEYLPDPQQAVFDEERTPSVLADFLLLNREEVLITEDQIRHDFAGIHARAQEGGYPFDKLKAMQDQVVELYAMHPDSPVGFLGFYPHNSAVPRQAFCEVGGFAADIPFSEGWDLAYRLQRTGVRPGFARQALTYHLYHYHEFSDPSKLADEQSTRVQAIDYMVRENRDPRLRMIELWRAGIWPDPLIPDELVLRDLLHFHERYGEVQADELAEIEAVLRRHPARAA